MVNRSDSTHTYTALLFNSSLQLEFLKCIRDWTVLERCPAPGPTQEVTVQHPSLSVCPHSEWKRLGQADHVLKYQCSVPVMTHGLAWIIIKNQVDNMVNTGFGIIVYIACFTLSLCLSRSLSLRECGRVFLETLTMLFINHKERTKIPSNNKYISKLSSKWKTVWTFWRCILLILN